MGFDTLLVANRGEIAARILRCARGLGYRTVAVYSDADADSPVLALADEAVRLGPAPATDSYLNIDALLGAARRTGADAIHPGYGFLSEQAEFARRCRQAGLLFIGPEEETIELMGDKARAKGAALEAGVPCLPGYQGEDQRTERLCTEARALGLPVMIKAAAGGGGKGMRLARRDEELADLIALARSEAARTFGCDRLILEPALAQARHIEVQVFADHHGHYLHLGERDCSLQRRHQKVVEEAPAPGLGEALRRRLGRSAVALASHCRYQGAGTVEFLLSPQGEYYFLEMNTRLQVEHPVTELISGQDLVAWQLRVAAGEPLPLTQAQLCNQGCAVEARVYAEDPERGFLPATGVIKRWRPPAGPGIRVEHALAAGVTVSRHYDPLLAKVVAWGEDRPTALRRLRRALERTQILGVTTNLGYLVRLLGSRPVIDAEANTGYLDSAPQLCAAPEAPDWLWACAALVFCGTSPPRRPMSLTLDYGKESRCLRLEPRGERCRVRLGQNSVDAEVCRQDSQLICTSDGHRRTLEILRQDAALTLTYQGQCYHFLDQTLAPPASGAAVGDGQALAPMDGCIRSVLVQPGQSVEQGQPLLTLEAMKMELPLTAGRSGTVTRVSVTTGEQVTAQQLLITIED
ncbi:3-methylcrotonyl-CoA carboxylase [Ferrimonas sediminicola]|uniref:Biotin carboxylase n=1 Tax=Ferrimonas sediminicola TaxID=2569538 RepID=A0A4U1BHI5_9GAMM|nr:biotin carboxylase N-terminal domain-containing protein [Ferrimonas sediminicola]TKB50507.1 3-methylcrotonyl-CoA carboxylase [Ferrimonas sediminicola]